MQRAYIRNLMVSRNKDLYVIFYVALLIVAGCMYAYVLLIRNITNISINFVQNIGYNQRDITVNTTWDIYNKDIRINQRAFQPREKGGNYLSKGRCYGEMLKIIREKINRSDNTTKKLSSNEISTYIEGKCGLGNRISCKMELIGRTSVQLDHIRLHHLGSVKNLSFVKPGGWWLPTNCKIKRNVAVVIPFRNRDDHLAIFLRHMHPILQRQQLHYRIFVIDQVDGEKFNRGKLMNVGYSEALKLFPYDCFVFHDVDLVLEDDRNSYGCIASPQHLSIAVDKFKYKILYEELFGGIEMFSRSHFELVNGFSNSFWGWGAEDDNLYRRLAWKKLDLWRSSTAIGRYKMLSHLDAEGSADKSRFTLRKESYKHYSTDGLVNLQYDVKQFLQLPYHTHIKVDLRKDKDRMFGVMPFPKK